MACYLFNTIKNTLEFVGIDLFVFRPNAECISRLINTPLQLGRAAWDNFWADKIKNKLPYNVCYHLPHKSEWETSEGFEGNYYNLSSISKHSKPVDIGVEEYDTYYRDVK